MNYYQVPKDQYQEKFQENCTEMAELLSVMESIFSSKKISLLDIGPRVSWYMFESLITKCDNQFRPVSDETLFSILENPPVLQEITTLKSTIQDLVNNMNHMCQCLDELSCMVNELVPPPAQTDGIEDEALAAEYCVRPSEAA